MSYSVLLRPPAQKFLRKLRDKTVATRLVNAMRDLAENPRATGTEKLSGTEELYRIRVGDYRLVYEIQDKALVVLIVKIGHRRDVNR